MSACRWWRTGGLSALFWTHIIHGHYSFALPDLGGNHRPPRDPDAPGEE